MMDTTPIRDRWFTRPGLWFWLAIALGAALRFYFVAFTDGTYDIGLWKAQIGVNHPPFIKFVESLFLRAADATGIHFRIFLRAPFALLDAGSSLLLLLLLGENRWRWVLAACCWLNPLAIIFSAYHGNTDSAVPFFLLLCVWLLSKGNTVGGAIAAGAGLWIKLPGILAFPALVFFIRGWRRRLLFLVVAGAIAISTYLPALVGDARRVVVDVFGYHGCQIHTAANVTIWGPNVLLFSFIAPPQKWPVQFHAPILFFINHSWQLALFLALGLTWLRRSRLSVPELCATIGMVYVIIYGWSDNWAFQYFAWSLPFWFFLRPWFFVPAIVFGSAYVYSLYWLVCGNPWLLGQWDFVGHPTWPAGILWIRNFTVLFFFLSACVFLAVAIAHELKSWRKSTALASPDRP